MARFLFLVFAVFLITWKNSEACSCLPGHPQNNYCLSDFVIRATPVKRNATANEFQVFYTLKDIKIFKANPKARVALNTKRVFTASNSALCGVELQLNRRYLLHGGVSEKKASIGLCGFNGLWRDIPAYQKEAIQDGTYKEGCSCKIETCFGEDCGEKTDDQCQFNIQEGGFCYSQWSTCLKDDDDVCNWTESDDLTECLDAQQTPAGSVE